jgi:hypothetical protein
VPARWPWAVAVPSRDVPYDRLARQEHPQGGGIDCRVPIGMGAWLSAGLSLLTTVTEAAPPSRYSHSRDVLARFGSPGGRCPLGLPGLAARLLFIKELSGLVYEEPQPKRAPRLGGLGVLGAKRRRRRGRRPHHGARRISLAPNKPAPPRAIPNPPDLVRSPSVRPPVEPRRRGLPQSWGVSGVPYGLLGLSAAVPVAFQADCINHNVYQTVSPASSLR